MASMYEAEAKKGTGSAGDRSIRNRRSQCCRRVLLGEIYELKAELNSDKRDRKKEAVKKVGVLVLQCL